ncbi:MAG: bifunctional DNA-formamidopyrimidine glycosylase/DNA-(apurinic or apyrimidinic site) lyase [Deltaproteobacteria bacterium]|nr:bifunctional DNA-formamidopyrimidine glycosylase/DNA-(apurinic or apyrimidinic site) lyase [Deltaproteobacteria bacterium]MCW5800807.1 bifunctional DNA-formamidopyrimidine glycosylase/DNA-(apurinic or apyrimidinic site) lyase [Deltaproteobacteria bacterium]
MPELPEVETIRRTLAPAVGARITSAWTSGMGLHMNRRPPRAKLQKLVGTTITGVRRHGKYLLIDTDGPYALLAHMGMTGRLRLHAAREARAPHTHVVFGLSGRSPRELRYSDPRRFGQIDVVERGKEREHPALGALGPDALEGNIDGDVLYAASRKRKQTMKAFVLDQSVIAGMGNIYASEALWRAQVRPTKRARLLTRAQATALADAIHEVIAKSLDNGGTTLADFVAADGAVGENADHLWVYDRAGQPCPRCEAIIKRAVHQGRATYYCPTCQTA